MVTFEEIVGKDLSKVLVHQHGVLIVKENGVTGEIITIYDIKNENYEYVTCFTVYNFINTFLVALAGLGFKLNK